MPSKLSAQNEQLGQTLSMRTHGSARRWRRSAARSRPLSEERRELIGRARIGGDGD